MIRVSLSDLIFIYMALFLTVVFGVWLVSEWKRQYRERRAVRHRVRCAMCAFDFEDTTEERLLRCPRCGSLTERRPFSVL